MDVETLIGLGRLENGIVEFQLMFNDGLNMHPENQSICNKPKTPRYMWLIPFAMLLAAILACSPAIPAQPPLIVDLVEASPDTMGKVYARVGLGLSNYVSATNDEFTPKIYVTTDYGATWKRSQYDFDEPATNSYDMYMHGENLELNGQTIWAFPRSTFRQVFNGGFQLFPSSTFVLPTVTASNSAQGDTVYVAMGTQGVLVANYDGNRFTDWKLRAKGIDSLNPLPLTITNSGTIISIVVYILIIPPFALIHAYLLQRVWVYLLPANQATDLALGVTAGFVILAIVGSIIWLTNDQTDLYPIIGVLTLITVVISGSITAWLARKAAVSHKTGIGLTVATVLLSLVVPIGVAGIFTLWWAIYAVVFSYWAYHYVYWLYIDYDGCTELGRRQRWNVDRLALEMVLIVVAGSISIIIQLGLLQTFLASQFIPLLGLGLVVAGFWLVFQNISRHRAKAILQLDQRVTNKRPQTQMLADLRLYTFYWIVAAIIATVATFILQMGAYNWFTTLLK